MSGRCIHHDEASRKLRGPNHRKASRVPSGVAPFLVLIPALGRFPDRPCTHTQRVAWQRPKSKPEDDRTGTVTQIGLRKVRDLLFKPVQRAGVGPVNGSLLRYPPPWVPVGWARVLGCAQRGAASSLALRPRPKGVCVVLMAVHWASGSARAACKGAPQGAGRRWAVVLWLRPVGSGPARAIPGLGFAPPMGQSRPQNAVLVTEGPPQGWVPTPSTGTARRAWFQGFGPCWDRDIK